jgi:16S rRNA (guanine527-N7)-methyltransferase
MDNKQLLIDGCSQIGINLTQNIADKFFKYKDILLEWNQKINLTAITEENEIILKHFIDSLSVLKFTSLSNKNVIDVGTGAGFPGIPLKIVDDTINLTLLDSLNKRVNFLEEVKNSLNMDNVNIIHGRAEDFGVKKDFREAFDICVPRAVANLSTLCEYCLPFVSLGGYLISLKGPDIEEELNGANNAISILGGELERIEKFQIPTTDIIHSIVFIKKVRRCPTHYPRKAGKPSKEPLK